MYTFITINREFRVFRGQPNILLLLFITLGNFGLVHFILHKPSRRSIFLGPTACQASTVQYVRHPVKLIRYVHDTRCTTGCQAESMWECGQRGAGWTWVTVQHKAMYHLTYRGQVIVIFQFVSPLLASNMLLITTFSLLFLINLQVLSRGHLKRIQRNA